MKKITAITLSALLLTGCSANQPLTVSYVPIETAKEKFERESDVKLDFEKPPATLKKVEAKPQETFEPLTAEDVDEIIASIPVEEVQPLPPAPVVEQPIAPTPPQPEAPIEEPVGAEFVEETVVAPPVAPPAPAPSNWAQDILNANGYGHITVTIGDAQGMCASTGVNAVGCSAVGTSTFTLAAHLVADAAGIHVLWHETAHALGETSECAAEEFAWSMTGNRTLASYPNCL